MAIAVDALKQRCLERGREVEATGRAVAITRRGRVVAQLEPALEPGGRYLVSAGAAGSAS